MYIIYSLNVQSYEIVCRNTYNSLKNAQLDLENVVKQYVEMYKKNQCITVTTLPKVEGWYAIRDENSIALYRNTLVGGWISNTILNEKLYIFGIMAIDNTVEYVENPTINVETIVRQSVRNNEFFNELNSTLKNRRRDIED